MKIKNHKVKIKLLIITIIIIIVIVTARTFKVKITEQFNVNFIKKEFVQKIMIALFLMIFKLKNSK